MTKQYYFEITVLSAQTKFSGKRRKLKDDSVICLLNVE